MFEIKEGSYVLSKNDVKVVKEAITVISFYDRSGLNKEEYEAAIRTLEIIFDTVG
ncbi:hypothetical protein [Priestia aryabhattai]|uniref:hypothetical protein n=1 Tax=Priestia aryabhattai TaxID=412384 RepID=UPI0015F3D8CB|nr:hypothetical protein [Priestia aryabhattai]